MQFLKCCLKIGIVAARLFPFAVLPRTKLHHRHFFPHELRKRVAGNIRVADHHAKPERFPYCLASANEVFQMVAWFQSARMLLYIFPIHAGHITWCPSRNLRQVFERSSWLIGRGPAATPPRRKDT